MPQLRTHEPVRHPQPSAKASALSHVAFERPDLEQAERFLRDFGLQVSGRDADTLYLRGTAPAPYCYRVRRAPKARFVGLGLEVPSRDALDALARVPGASAVQPALHPGGGEHVVLTDPSGFSIEAIYGRPPAEALSQRAPLSWNVGQPARRINASQRPPSSAPEVVRLGHVVLEVADFQATCAFYTQHFGFIPSDVQVFPDGSPAVAFLRLDRGDTPTDHHTLAIAQGFMPAYSHSAYELIDADAVGMGQRLLRERGFRHAWGIGRHILGSQIFDYWNDPWGEKHEHYCDGDLFTADVPTGIHPVSRDAMAQWGQAMPSSFVRPKLTPGNVAALLRHLNRSPDLSVRKLITLARLFG
jgi:catechol 2,3-dioxygenase-like lactoylglutathione lyase family enzyme